MNSELNVVAATFHYGAFVLGLPALAVLLLYALFRIRSGMTPLAAPLYVGKNPDAVILTISTFARILGAVVGMIVGIAKALSRLLAVFSAVVVLYAISLWLTSRGLSEQARWARGAAAGLVILPTVLALVSLTFFRGALFLLAALTLGAGIYALRALWLGFAT